MRFDAAVGLAAAIALGSAASALTPPQVFSPSTTAVDPGFRAALLSESAVDAEASGMLEISPQQMPIDWASARADLDAQNGDPLEPVARGVPVRPDNAGRAEFDAVSLPVLLPDRGAIDSGDWTTRLFARQGFYTASITSDEVVIEIFGTRQRLSEPPDAGSARRLAEARDADGFIVTPGEGSWDVAFNRYGAAYSVMVECADPAAERCANADYARTVALSLLIAGGQPGRD